MESLSDFVKHLRTKYRFYYYGVPFLTVIIAGSFGLQQLAQLRYQYRKGRTLTAEEASEMGLEDLRSYKTSKTLEQIHQETQNTLNISSWENKRGPHFWEMQQERES